MGLLEEVFNGAAPRTKNRLGDCVKKAKANAFAETFEEDKHPRDHGKFATAAGTDSGVSDKPSESTDAKPSAVAHPSTTARLLAKTKPITEAVARKATRFVDSTRGGRFLRGLAVKLRDKAIERYGAKTVAKIIASGHAISWGAFGVGLAVGYPNFLPSSACMIPAAVLAELKYQMGDGKRAVTESAESDEYGEHGKELTPEQIDAEAQKLVEELSRAWGEHAAASPDNKPPEVAEPLTADQMAAAITKALHDFYAEMGEDGDAAPEMDDAAIADVAKELTAKTLHESEDAEGHEHADKGLHGGQSLHESADAVSSTDDSSIVSGLLADHERDERGDHPNATAAASPTVDDDPRSHAEQLAEILYGAMGNKALEALTAKDLHEAAASQYVGTTRDRHPVVLRGGFIHVRNLLEAWNASAHPRGHGGRFVKKGSEEAVATAQDAVGKALRGESSGSDAAKNILQHLNLLTVKQLAALHKEHGKSIPGKLREQLVQGVLDRVGNGEHHKAAKDLAAGPSAEKLHAAALAFAEKDPNDFYRAVADAYNAAGNSDEKRRAIGDFWRAYKAKKAGEEAPPVKAGPQGAKALAALEEHLAALGKKDLGELHAEPGEWPASGGKAVEPEQTEPTQPTEPIPDDLDFGMMGGDGGDDDDKAVKPEVSATLPADNKGFANTVKQAIAEMPYSEAGYKQQGAFFGGNKVFINHVFEQMKKQFPSLTMDEFKKRLGEANASKDLTISRSDMNSDLHTPDVEASKMRHGPQGAAEGQFITNEKGNWRDRPADFKPPAQVEDPAVPEPEVPKAELTPEENAIASIYDKIDKHPGSYIQAAQDLADSGAIGKLPLNEHKAVVDWLKANHPRVIAEIEKRKPDQLKADGGGPAKEPTASSGPAAATLDPATLRHSAGWMDQPHYDAYTAAIDHAAKTMSPDAFRKWAEELTGSPKRGSRIAIRHGLRAFADRLRVSFAQTGGDERGADEKAEYMARASGGKAGATRSGATSQAETRFPA